MRHASCRGSRETYSPHEMNFPRFTAWLGNYSSSNKQRRIAGELTTKLLAAGANCDRRGLRLHYLPTLRHALTAHLAKEGADGIDATLALMQDYLISRCGRLAVCHAAREPCGRLDLDGRP